MSKARSLVSRVPEKDYAGEIRALHRFVRDDIRYTRDINGVETLAIPQKTLEFKAGDCDDKSVLLASLLEAVGFQTRFTAVGFSPGNYCHVLPEVLYKGKWLPLEVTEPVEPGWFPPDVISEMTVYNRE